MKLRINILVVCMLALGMSSTSIADDHGKIKVGVLHSLSGRPR